MTNEEIIKLVLSVRKREAIQRRFVVATGILVLAALLIAILLPMALAITATVGIYTAWLIYTYRIEKSAKRRLFPEVMRELRDYQARILAEYKR